MLSDGLLSWYSLDELSGVRANSSSGPSMSLSGTNTIGFGRGMLANTLAVKTGPTNSSYYEAADTTPNLAGTSFTVSAYAFRVPETTPTATEVIVSKYNGDANDNGVFSMQFRQVRGRISALVDLHATSGSIPVFLEQTLDDPMIYGKWVHVAMSWDIVNGVMQFWVNNELIRSAFGERNFSTNRITTDVCKMRVGAGYSPAERFLNGYVDCFGVWNRVLSNAEVGDLYYTGFGRQYPFSYPRQA